LLWASLFAFFFFHKVLSKMKRIFTLSILAAAILATGCTRIETGEVGVRVGFDKQVQPGRTVARFVQSSVIGDVLHSLLRMSMLHWRI
jgi:hypothetical protein